ncbi:hypothetical protein KC19_VG091000 [Ceratodon purpureus]|uniref:Zinc finger PHD-type domain-containing protein n=1 Tax=Ceratodon purpureus TaxID=3225 RepID=A0A8T0HP59_CERPU|nr:hypothetical protein KC19_VG091000 [Ceratodon purpureus]
MDKIEPGASTSPQAIARPCRGAMYRPRERTVQELLRHTHKICKPRPSPVLIDGARMQGPGVKEECYSCGEFVAAEELQQCSVCDRGFHTTCLDPAVNVRTRIERSSEFDFKRFLKIVTLGLPWCCGLCDDYKSRGGDTGAADRTPSESMTSCQNTGGLWNSIDPGGKKKPINVRGSTEVVQQEEASLLNTKSLWITSHDGKASRSKRGRLIESTAQVIHSKRRQIDSGISKLKPDDGNVSSSVPEQLGEVEDRAVEFKGAPVEERSRLGINPPASFPVTDSIPGKAPAAVFKAGRNDANVDTVGMDKEVPLHRIQLRDSDGIFIVQDSFTESSAVVSLDKVPDICMVQVVKSEEVDASHEVSGEIMLQNVDADLLSWHVNDHHHVSAAEAETVPPKSSMILLSSPQNVGIELSRNVVEQEGKVLPADQQVNEQVNEAGCTSDPLCSGNEKEIAAATHGDIEDILSGNTRRHASHSVGKPNFEPMMEPVLLSALLMDSSSPSIKLSASSHFNNYYSSVTTTSPMSSALPFEGFQSQSRDDITFCSPITPQFSKPALEQSGADGKNSLVAKPLLKAFGSSSSPFTSTSPYLKSEKCIPSDYSPSVEDKPHPAVYLPQTSAAPVALLTDVNLAETLDSQLSNLVSGLPLPAQRARKGSLASLPVFEVRGFVTELSRKPRTQTMDLPQLGLAHTSRASKELSRSSLMRDHGSVNSVLSKTLENGSRRLEPDEVLSGRSKESNGVDYKDGSPSDLLVEDVKVCDTCGNAGYEELLALCSSCNEGAEHTYCMRIQMDSLPDGDWFCESCQMKQRQGGPKSLERLFVPSKSLGRSTSINSRSKPVANQGSSRSRLVDRLNNKKSRIAPVKKSPSKAPTAQMILTRLPDDSPASPIPRKLPMESSLWATPSTSPSSSLPVSTSIAKPLLTRENTFKSAPDTGKVKFLAPSAVANFSYGPRANATKPVVAASTLPKAGQAGNKSRFVSLSTISESSTLSPIKAINLNSSRASLTTSPTPILSKSPSGKLSAAFSTLSKLSCAKLSTDFPSSLLNSNSRQGNGMRGSGQSKNSRDGGNPDGVSMSCNGREAPSSASQPSGSKLMRLGRNISSSGLTGEPRPSPDTPRPTLESGRGAQRSGQTGELRSFLDTPRPSLEHAGGNQRLGLTGDPRPSPDMPRPPVENGRGSYSSGPGIGCSIVAGTGQDARQCNSKEKGSFRSDPALGVVGLAGSGRVTLEPASVSGFPGKKSKPNTTVWSAPWLGDSSSTRCFSCKTVGHSIQECSNLTSVATEQKAMSGISYSPSTSPNPLKNSVPMFSDIDSSVSAGGLKAGFQEKTNSSTGLLIPTESVPEGCSLDSEKSKPPLPSTPTDLVRRRSPNVKIHHSSAAGFKTRSLLISTSFQQLVTGETPGGVSSLANGDISSRHESKAVSGPGGNLWTLGEAYDNEGPLGVPDTETVYVDFKIAAAQNDSLPLAKFESVSSPNASQATDPKIPQGHVIMLTEAAVGPASQILQRTDSAWGPRPPWLEALPTHAAQSHGPGRVGYPSGLVQSFPPSGPVMCSQGPPISYLTSQPPPPVLPYAPAPPPVPSPTPPSSAAQVVAAVPSAAIAWRGAFEVNDGQSTIMFDEILAHVSTKAVTKVHQVATSLPQQLRLEQVQRATDLETWPRQFNSRPPTDGSIALYFFASNGESFEKFRHNLVDKMVAQDLALRAHVDDAELLIFPSDKLSEKFQRWHGHMFLWGVFRARKQAVKTVSTTTLVVKESLMAAPCFEISTFSPYFVPRAAPVCNINPEMKHPNFPSSGCDNSGEVDMEVDMVGGKECGFTDEPVKRPDSANLPSNSPLSPTGASIMAPVALARSGSAPECFALDLNNAGNVQSKAASIKPEDLDLPPGFAPALTLPPIPVALGTPTLGTTLTPGFAKKTEAQKQVELGSSATGAEYPEQRGSKLKRRITSLEVGKDSSTAQTSPVFAKQNSESSLLSSRPSTTKRSRTKSRSLSRPKEMERDKVRDRLCERVKDRERKDTDLKHERHDRSCERAREVRDRDRGRDYEREKDGLRPRDRDRDINTYDSIKERERPRDKDRVRERERERERDRNTGRKRGRDRERERERERERDWPLDRGKDRKSYRPRNNEQDLDTRIRYRRSRSRSRSRSPARRKPRSRSPCAGRRKAGSRTPLRQRTRSPSLLRRYRQLSVSGSDSPDSQSLEILQGLAIAGPRSRKPLRERVQGKRSVMLDRDVDDKVSRPSMRWNSAWTVDDTRSGSAGASNSKTIGKLGHSKTVPISRSVTPVLDMNEGVSETFSAEFAAVSTSLPDLNTDSVQSCVAFHDFLPADDSGPSREPETDSRIVEQTFFPGLSRAAITPSRSTRLNFRSQDHEPTLARERLGFAVSSLGSSRRDYILRSSSEYPFLQAPSLEDSVYNPNPDLELALGGRETSPKHTVSLPLFVDGHARSSPDLGFALIAKSPDLSVKLSTHQLGPPGMVCGDASSLSLSLAVPQYRREGNSWVEVEEHGDVSDGHDVDFSLTL